MAIDGDITLENLCILENAEKVFLYTQPNHFPHPWGLHPNFQCHCPAEVILGLNKMSNVFYWNFTGRQPKTGIKYDIWKKEINVTPLAYDSISYNLMMKNNKYAYDVCYVGGRANNGLDEKYKIMLNFFQKFRNSKRKIGIFINKNLSHQQENLILCSSKVCLNIHDNYQKKLMTCDTNERTFKSLGCNGIMVSDREGFVTKNFPNLKVSETPDQMLELAEYYLNMPDKELLDLKAKYQNIVLTEHTYINRVSGLLSCTNKTYEHSDEQTEQGY